MSALTVSRAAAQAQALGLPRLEAQILLLHAMGRSGHDRAWLLAHGDDPLEDEVQTIFNSHVQRRLDTEPVD